MTHTPEAELERIIARMQRIQRDIIAVGQPASLLQLEELQELGREYARIVEMPANAPHATARA